MKANKNGGRLFEEVDQDFHFRCVNFEMSVEIF